MLAGYHQDMRRRLRVKVIERDAIVVFVDAFRWNGARNYLAENAVFSTHDQIKQLNHKHPVNVNCRISGMLDNRDRFIGQMVVNAFYVGTKCAEFSNYGFVTTVNVINAVDGRLAVCGKPS